MNKPNKMFTEFFNEFTAEVVPRLPWAQILNPTDPKNHGFFINKENASVAGLDTSSFQPYEHTFRGEEASAGFLTRKIAFCRILKTPVIVAQDGKNLGLFWENGKITQLGELAIANPIDFRRKCWWLVVPLDEKKQPISQSPIRLVLSGATGVALSQEIRKAEEEIEREFFVAQGLAPQGLTEKVKALFVHSWQLGAFKPSPTKAAFEVVTHRKGILKNDQSTQSQLRYTNKNHVDRNVEVISENLENLIVLPSSDLGQKIEAWREEHNAHMLSLYADHIKQDKNEEATTTISDNTGENATDLMFF